MQCFSNTFARKESALGTMPKNPVAVKTIVTTDICKKIAAEYNVELREVLTGFKFIGEQIGFLEKEDRTTDISSDLKRAMAILQAHM